MIGDFSPSGILLLAPLLLLSPPPAAAQAGLLSDPVVMTLVEEVLISDLMLRTCAEIRPSEEGLREVERIADDLARRAGHTPESAAEVLSGPEAIARAEAGAQRRLAMMGARPDETDAICAVALRAVDAPGVIGALLERVDGR